MNVYDPSAAGQPVLNFAGNTGGNLAANNLAHRYLSGPVVDMLLADEQVSSLTSAGTVDWALTDQQNSLRDVAQYNAGVTSVVGHTSYDSYGNATSTGVRLAFGYTGLWLDNVTGFYGTMTRWYDPHTGRWTSEDWIEFYGDPSNIGRYVGNAPTNGTDPTGLEDENSIGGPRKSKQGKSALPPLYPYTDSHGNTVFAGGFVGLPISSTQCPTQAAGPIPPPIPTDPTQPPGEGWEWKGAPGSRPGDPDGNWVDGAGNKLHPDLKHPIGKDPHWGWKDPYGNGWDWFPDIGKWKPQEGNRPNRPTPQFPPGTLMACGAAAGIGIGIFITDVLPEILPWLLPLL